MKRDEEGMSKYAVEEDDRHRKQASGAVTCPLCGRRAVEEGSTYLCPTHGSQGFERS